MKENSFDVRCDDCGRNVTIRSVYGPFKYGGFKGYSYGCICECGARVEANGCDGEFIPISMKRRAAEQGHGPTILRAIDAHRRSLAPSATKSMLSESRVPSPRLIDDNSWIVYRLPDGRSITYTRESKAYGLIDFDPVQRFSDINALADHLAGG
jgi:hypothetical protein